jgi:formylglycine-generating enzyme required for sulfatase activity
MMGSPEDELGREHDEIPHWVRLTKAFWIGRYPVTQSQYEAVMGNNPSGFKGERRPVENVSWHDAVEFCHRLNKRVRQSSAMPDDFEFRLPTEAEWEHACRAGTTSAFNDGSPCTKPEGNDPALDRLGWFNENSDGETHSVGEKAPNAWGLYDTHGNVWEWCLDGMQDYTTQPQIDPMGPLECARRVVRGGSFWDGAGRCQSAFRLAYEPCDPIWNMGFRLAAGQELGSGATASGASGLRAGPRDEAPAERPERGAS